MRLITFNTVHVLILITAFFYLLNKVRFQVIIKYGINNYFEERKLLLK